MNEHPLPGKSPVELALRSLWVIGASCAVFGLVFVVMFGFFNTFERFRPWFILMGTALWLGPGVSYLLCAAFMRRQSVGAATIALSTVVFQAAGAAILLGASATFEPISPIPILLGVLWLIGLADCGRHLLRARRFLASDTERVHGFEMVAAKPVLPLHVEDSARGA